MTKRMSADEKRKVILDIYHKSQSVYTEKEILTLASKAGVNANTYVACNDWMNYYTLKKQTKTLTFLYVQLYIFLDSSLLQCS